MISAFGKRQLLVFAKSPEVGRVKTRIAREAGPHKAAAIYEELLSRILRQSDSDDQWERLLFITPESDADYFHKQGLRTMVQQGRDIGERMGNAFRDSVQSEAGQFVLIGSDIPDLTGVDIANAFRKLETVPAVIGPSEDGGFYLFGVAKEYLPVACLLLSQTISWSSPTVLAEVEKWCRVYQLPLGYLPQKTDIDTYADWVRYQDSR